MLNAMETRRLGKTELSVTTLGFGAAPIGLLDIEQTRVENILNLLLDKGVNFIDTAASYQGSEQAIGKAVAHRRDQYLLLSKCGRAMEGLAGEPWSAKVISQTIDQSLKHLKTDHLDIMLLHSCDLETLKKGDALGALVKAKTQGKIRFAGYSGDNQEAAFAATLNDVSVIETSINVADQANIDSVLPLCRKHDIGVIAKRPLANAAWKEISSQPGFYKGYAETYTQRLTKMGLEPYDLGYTDHREIEWPDIALRFTIAQPGVHTAIAGTTSPTNAQANLLSAGKPPLHGQVVEQLRTAFIKARGEEHWPAQK